MDRRTFLQRLLATAAAFGIPPAGLVAQGSRYQQAMAAGTRRLALLIGINHYSEAGDSLQGCLTDLELQKEVLMHRFSFAEAEILTLREGQASLNQVRAAFQEFLGESGNPPETVVVHFSGHGRLIGGELTPAAAAGSLWEPPPHPALLLAEANSSLGSGYVTWSEWDQWVAGLPTPQVTTILDCGFSYAAPAIRGNLQLRSRPTLRLPTAAMPIANLPSSEMADSGQGSLPSGLTPSRGLLVSATHPQSLAAEASWSGFTAGILTYLLTQYLWETTPASKFYATFQQMASRRELGTFSCQQPSLQGQETTLKRVSPYFLKPSSSTGITGVVQEIKGNRVQVWLGGIPPAALCGLQNGSQLAVLTPKESPTQILTIRSRSGLWAQAQPMPADAPLPMVGSPLREKLRMLSGSLKLVVGLDDSLGRIEKVDITNSLASLNGIETANPREKQVDCLLARLTGEWADALQLPNNSYGLFWAGRDPVKSSAGVAGEAAGAAVQRLLPRLRHLLAAKRIRATLNPGVSELSVTVSLRMPELSPLGGNRPVLHQQTATAKLARSLAISGTGDGTALFQAGDPLQLQLENESNRDLFVYLLMLDAAGHLHILAPIPHHQQTQAMVLAARSTTLIPPQPDSNFSSRPRADLFTCHPNGLIELLIVATTRPPTTTLDWMNRMTRDATINQAPLLLTDPLEWSQTLLAEVTTPVDSDLSALDHAELASFSMTYGVI